MSNAADNEVEVDPTKNCWNRWAHRDIMGVDRDGMRVCPACMPAP